MVVFEWHRLALVFWLLYENYHYNKNTTLHLSEKTKKQLNLMFKTAISQVVVFLAFAFPLAIWIFSIFLPMNDSILHISYLCLMGFTILYPIVDVIAVVLIISTYRTVVKNILQSSWGAVQISRDTKVAVF